MAVGGITVLVALVAAVIAANHFSLTSDIGSYLHTHNWVLGQDPTGIKPLHFRPPLIGYVLLPFTALFGDLTGSKVLAVLAWASVPGPAYLFARLWLSPRWALGAAAAIAFHPLMADIFIGGFISLFGIALTLLAWSAQIKLERGGGKPWMVLLILSAFALVGLNQTTMALYWIGAGLLWFTGPHDLKSLVTLSVAGVLSLAWMPFYLVHVDFGGRFYLDGVDWLVFWPEHLITPVLLITGLMATVYGPSWSRRFLLPLAVFGVAGSLSSGDALINNLLHRAAYLVPLVSVIPIVGFLSTLTPKHPIRGAVVAVAVVSVTLGGIVQADIKAGSIATLTPQAYGGVQWITENTPKTARVWVHPHGLAWWVGGLAPRDWGGSWTVPLEGYAAEQDAALCALGWISDCDPYAAKMQFNLSYFLIDRGTWQPIAPSDVEISNSVIMTAPTIGTTFTQGQRTLWDTSAPLHPWLTSVYENGSVIIYAYGVYELP